MKKDNLLIAAALAGALFFRITIFILTITNNESHLMFGSYIIHHFWLGFVLIFISLLLSIRYTTSKIVFAGAGLGIIADELIFMFLGGGGYAMYWKPLSMIGAILCLALIYIFRRTIIYNILKEFK